MVTTATWVTITQAQSYQQYMYNMCTVANFEGP